MDDIYISKQQAAKAFQEYHDSDVELFGVEIPECFDAQLAIEIMNEVPAADVRPVVRCRECAHWERYDNTAGCGYCHKVKFEYGENGYVFNPVKEPDFYCADGRKADV